MDPLTSFWKLLCFFSLLQAQDKIKKSSAANQLKRHEERNMQEGSEENFSDINGCPWEDSFLEGTPIEP